MPVENPKHPLYGSDDTIFGDWVYCAQHLNPHTTGWCTAGNMWKVGLGFSGPNTKENLNMVRRKCELLGFKLYRGHK